MRCHIFKGSALFLMSSTLSISVVSTQGTKLWIIMEYLGGGSALDLVGRPAFSQNRTEI